MAMNITTDTLVKVENLEKKYPVGGGIFNAGSSRIHAVDGVNFDIKSGRSLGLVGESGCGKTTTGKLLVRLIEPTAGAIYLRTPEGELADIARARGTSPVAHRTWLRYVGGPGVSRPPTSLAAGAYRPGAGMASRPVWLT